MSSEGDNLSVSKMVKPCKITEQPNDFLFGNRNLMRNRLMSQNKFVNNTTNEDIRLS